MLSILSVPESSFSSFVNKYAFSITGGSSVSLTYIASERIIPGYFFHASSFLYYVLEYHALLCNNKIWIFILRYGGGMSSAKAALESDTRVSSLFLFLFFSCSSFFFIFFLCAFILKIFCLFSQMLVSEFWFILPVFLCQYTQVLAFEAGRKHRVRVNTISAGTMLPPSFVFSLFPNLKLKNK